MTTKYQLRIDTAGVRPRDFGEIVESAQKYGSAEIEKGDYGFPVAIIVTFDVGEAHGIQDLWDLRNIVDELSLDIGGLGADMHGSRKPMKVEE